MTRKTVHSVEKKEAMLKNHIAILRGLLEKKSMPQISKESKIPLATINALMWNRWNITTIKNNQDMIPKIKRLLAKKERKYKIAKKEIKFLKDIKKIK